MLIDENVGSPEVAVIHAGCRQCGKPPAELPCPPQNASKIVAAFAAGNSRGRRSDVILNTEQCLISTSCHLHTRADVCALEGHNDESEAGSLQ